MRRAFVLGGVLIVLVGLALAQRAAGERSLLWRAHLGSLMRDHDGDVRNDLLRDGGDPFAVRRRLLGVVASGGDRAAWRAFAASAASPRPDYEAIDRAVEGLDPQSLPRGADGAYRYLQLWSFWQRNRTGSAEAALQALVAAGLPAGAAAARLGEAAGPRGTVQLALPGNVRAAGAAAGPRFRLRRLLQLATGRLAIDATLETGSALAGRAEIVALSAAGAEFGRVAVLADGSTEVTTPRATLSAPGPWGRSGRHRLRIVWDAPTETLAVEPAGEPALRAPGAIAVLEPPSEIEVFFGDPGSLVVRDAVIAAAPR